METVKPKTKTAAVIRIVFHMLDLPFNAPRAECSEENTRLKFADHGSRISYIV